MVDQMKPDKITVITVCYNACETIESTIQSVLSQDYPDLEYIIVDGSSTDGTMEIIARYRDRIDRIISEKDEGIYDAMDKGIAAATGEWIHFRNAGDRFLAPHTLSAFFEAPVSQDVQIVHGDCIYTNEWGYRYMTPGILRQDHHHGMPFLHPATFVRTAYHKEHLFDRSLRSSGDYLFAYESCEEGVIWEYRPVPVALFPTGGFAMTQLRQTYREDCRIQGVDRTVAGRCKMRLGEGVIAAKTAALSLSGKIGFLRRLRIRDLRSEGWQDLPVPAELYNPAAL